jgi:hypothetical protein
MRIYLDSNVFRDLKKPENRLLYDLILVDRDQNYYCFSEAHIQDLVRDDTDRKLLDMDFMETIVGNNCWYYDKAMKVQFRTPREYYDDHDWNVVSSLMTSDDIFYVFIREGFRRIPLNWKQFIDTEQLPPDFPEDLRPMLLESATMLDFMEAMLDLTNNLSTEQPRFKRLLQYLHRSMGGHYLYEQLNIKGFDGNNFTDWETFAQSFKDLIYQRSNEKDLYNLFLEMQFSLDIYGIIKGKPKKQKFMSLLNDGKHAYYAGHAHILVTSDADMIAKTKLVYRVWQVGTIILTPEEFKQYLVDISSQDKSVAALFAQFDCAAKLPIIYEQYTLDQTFIQKELPAWYLGEFNTLSCTTARGSTYYYFRQYFPNIPFNTLTIELERVVNQLIDHFGPDDQRRGKLDRKEIENNDWKGREWRNGEMGILLYLDKGMVLSFFKAAPAKEEEEEIATQSVPEA